MRGRGSWKREREEIWVGYWTLANMCQEISSADAHDEGSQDIGDDDGNLKIDSDVVVSKEAKVLVDTFQCFYTHSNA